MAQEPLDYSKPTAPGNPRIISLYKHAYAIVAAMFVFLNVFPGGTRGSTLGSGFTSELGWPIAFQKEIYFVRGLTRVEHREYLPIDAAIALLVTVLFALSSRWYLNRLSRGNLKSASLIVPLVQVLIGLVLIVFCLAHLLFMSGM